MKRKSPSSSDKKKPNAVDQDTADKKPVKPSPEKNDEEIADEEKEKRTYRTDETDEQDSDGSANAFEGK